MGVYIPNMKMPSCCVKCHWYYECYDEHCTLGKFLLRKYPTDVSEEPYILDTQTHPDCPLIEIDEPNGILAHDIRKYIAFIDPHMIIATTYDEQIERAKAVKDWLLSIVGERRTDDSNT